MRGRASQTAEYTCFQRAREHRREADSRIVDDPFAERFLPMEWRAQLRLPQRVHDLGERVVEGLGVYCLARHRALDELLRAALTDGALGSESVEQVLIVGAGYDTRAWRFATERGERPLVEVDHPATAQRKAELLAVAGDDLDVRGRRVVTVDFTQQRLDERLLAEGFQLGRPTCVIWEGVSMYLPEEAVRSTLRLLGEVCGPGSCLGMDFWFPYEGAGVRGLWHRLSPRLLSLVGEPIVFGMPPDEVGAFMASEGAELAEVLDAEELGRRYVPDGRPVLPSIYVALARLGG